MNEPAKWKALHVSHKSQVTRRGFIALLPRRSRIRDKLRSRCPSGHTCTLRISPNVGDANAVTEHGWRRGSSSYPQTFEFEEEEEKIKESLEKQEQKLKEKRKQEKLKPKFQKQRKQCPYCLEKGIINRSRWSLRKMPKKKNQTQHWKGTCHKCGNIWSQNTSKEYWIIDPNQNFTNGL